MKSVLHRASRILILAVVVAVGLVLVYHSGRTEQAWRDFADCIAQDRLGAFGAGMFLFFLVMLYALTGLPRRRRDQRLTFPNDGGAVSVGINGISDYLAKLTGEFSSIVSIRPRIVPLKDEIDVDLDIKVKAGPDVRDVCELLQAQARRSLLEGLGISNVRKVSVNVIDIVSERKAPWRSNP